MMRAVAPTNVNSRIEEGHGLRSRPRGACEWRIAPSARPTSLAGPPADAPHLSSKRSSRESAALEVPAAAERPPRLRLFVALALPAEARDALARFRDAAADPAVWRPLDSAAFHVTLAFLGHRPAEDVPVVAEVLAGLAARGAPSLALGDALLLPPRRARVLTVALADDGALAELQAEISAGLAAAGVYKPEARPFRAHVTVARIRPGARAPRRIDAAPEPVAFRAGDVVLYRSRLARGGAAYEPLVTRRL